VELPDDAISLLIFGRKRDSPKGLLYGRPRGLATQRPLGPLEQPFVDLDRCPLGYAYILILDDVHGSPGGRPLCPTDAAVGSMLRRATDGVRRHADDSTCSLSISMPRLIPSSYWPLSTPPAKRSKPRIS
jgi:hypothetical protein